MTLETTFTHQGNVFNEEDLLDELTAAVQGGKEKGVSLISLDVKRGWGFNDETNKSQYKWTIEMVMK